MLTNEEFWLVFDYYKYSLKSLMQNKELFSTISVPVKCRMMKQLISAVNYLHQNGVRSFSTDSPQRHQA